MTISAKAFLALEASLTNRINSAAQAMAKPVYEKVQAALDAGDFQEAKLAVQGLDFTDLAQKVAPYILYCTNLSMLFGASRVTPNPGTSVVGMGHEKTMTAQAVQAFGISLGANATASLKATAMQLIALQEPKPDAPLGIFKAEGDRIIKDFASFMDDSGKSYFNMVSSLHTSRVSAYGFTAEADAMGITEYEINEQLDGHTCKVCKHMHGQVFKVRDAKQLLEVALRAKSPEDLKHIQPWPSQSADAMAEMRTMTPAQLVAQGWHIPPFHPRCRGLLARAGKAPTMDQIVAGTADDPYAATLEDFTALDLKTTNTQLTQWNSFATMGPAEFIARMRGLSLPDMMADLLDTEAPKDVTGVTSFKIGPTVSMRTAGSVYGSPDTTLQAVTMYPSAKNFAIQTLSDGGSPLSTGTVAQYLKGAVGVARDMEMDKLSVMAGKVFDGAEAVKAGFLPTQAAWNSLRSKLVSTVKSNPLWSKSPYLSDITAVLTSEDPAGIRNLIQYKELPLLLSGLPWAASLDLTDEVSMTLFLKYVGAIKA